MSNTIDLTELFPRNDITTIDKSGKLSWPYLKENSIDKTLIY